MKASKFLLGGILLFTLVNQAFAASWLECNGDSDKKIRWSGNTASARINIPTVSAAVR